jgi:hypothetical protein
MMFTLFLVSLTKRIVQKLIVAQLCKIFRPSYGTRRLIIVFSLPSVPVQSRMNSAHIAISILIL